MSLHPQTIPPVPVETARVARLAFPKGNVYLTMRDELGVFYTDAIFMALFPTRGQPAETPWRLALVMVMQYAEGLTDRQAADAVRDRLAWKYALSLELTDPGFDASVLSAFRDRLLAGSAEQQLLDMMLTRFQAVGLLKARGTQRTDSTHVVAAVRTLNRLECVGETVRHALNHLAVVAPDWLRLQVPTVWAERYGPRFDAYRLPKSQTAQQALAAQIGQDGRTLLEHIYRPDAPVWLRQVPAVETLRQVWLQQYQLGDTTLQWRSVDNQPPAARRIHSPYDVEARYSAKRTTEWVGYKAHFTETCDPDAPCLVTNVETTPATTSDFDLPDQIHMALAAKGWLPQTHLLDAGYTSADAMVTAHTDHAVVVVGPVPPDRQWQAQAEQGFDVASFTLDWEMQQAICPQGQTSIHWAARRDAGHGGREVITIRFAQRTCAVCPCRVQCTRATTGPRELQVRPQLQHAALQAARQQQASATFKAQYALRAGVEGCISQGVRVMHVRQARYIGAAKTHLQHLLTAAGLNLRRAVAWLQEVPHATTRIAPFVTLLTTAPAPLLPG